MHLDLDVLDPSVMPGTAYPAPGGSSAEGLRDACSRDVAAAATVIGIEVTGCPSASGAQVARVAALLAPLLVDSTSTRAVTFRA